MSEAVVITSNPLNGERIAGSVGYPMPGVSLRVDGGDVGTIQIKGPSVFSGYWRMPEKTKAEFTQDGYSSRAMLAARMRTGACGYPAARRI